MRKIVALILFLTSFSIFSQEDILANYDKREVYIPMRDGTKLFTAIYSPKDISSSKKYPIMKAPL